MTNLNERAGELQEELESHPYAEISNRLDQVQIVVDTLEQNYDVLSEFIVEWLEDEDVLFDAPLSQKMEIRRELFRRLHNYLASYHTQYEFTKNLRNDTVGEDSGAYNELMDKHGIRPTSDFLKGCRNYIQKRVFLNVTTSVEWEKETGENSVQSYISAEEFKDLRGSYRTDEAIEFVESCEGDKIVITDVIEEHHPDLLAFHDDFRNLLKDEYSAELEEYLELQSEHNEVMSELLDT